MYENKEQQQTALLAAVTVVLPVEGETTLPPLHSVSFLRSRV